MTSPIVQELIDYFKKRKELLPSDLSIKDIRVGVFYTGLMLSSGHSGVAFTPREELPEAICCPRSYQKMPDAGNLLNCSLWETLDYALDDNQLKRAIGIALINALSLFLMDKEKWQDSYNVIEDMDALDLIEVGPQDKVTMIGAFPPFIRKIKAITPHLSLLEKNPNALDRKEFNDLEIKLEEKEALSKADILIVTGVTLINHTIDSILSQSKGTREIVLVGPTASMIPQPLFDRGVTLMAGIKVLDSQRMLRVISEGGAGYDFFEGCGKKINISPKDRKESLKSKGGREGE